ncbi:unnamed protein product [Adineta ricciae]|uniref:Uncharacterized protein n=1 Tax=Adineta ricciae TaxID=249248 RepID=A0A813RS41_ADIRI|nr:unnamed protein product [Adineta ricciae]
MDELSTTTNQVDEVISSALHCLTRILSSPCISLTPTASSSSLPSLPCRNSSISTPNRSLQPEIIVRCRSSSRNNRREKNLPFHHTIPRCSLPATKNDLVHYESHLSTSKRSTHGRCRSSHNVNRQPSFDIQYSFSLNTPWSTRVDKQRHHHLLNIQNFANELIEHSIRAAFLQIDYQNITDDSSSTYEDDTSCLLFDRSPSSIPIERIQVITSYADQFVHKTIQQSIEEMSFSTDNIVVHISDCLVENAITDALLTLTGDEIYSQSLLTDDEKHTRKSQKRSIETIRLVTNENTELQASCFHQIRHRSSSAFRSILNNNTSPTNTVDSVVNNLTQQIYTDSFEELQRIFTKTSDEE